MIHLWRGFHHQDLLPLLRQAWHRQELVLMLPVYQKDFSFLGIFGEAQFSFHGDWNEELTKEALAQPWQPLKATDEALLKNAVIGIFTSGTSSGASRLVFYSAQNINSSLAAIRDLYQTSRLKKIFAYPQPTHTFGLVLGYLQAMLFDLKLEALPGPYSKKTHEHWLSVVDEDTLTLGTPTHFIDLLQWVKSRGVTPPRSYSAIIGGARATKELWHQLQDTLKIESPSVGYGATEASPGVAHLPPGIPPREDGDIGYALKGVHIEKVPNEGILFSGPNLCLAIYEHGRLRSSDKILLRDHLVEDRPGPEARYSFVGRTDLLLNRGGVKLSLEMIEGKVASHFGVKCLALAVFDERLGEDIALLLPTDHHRPEEKFLKEVQQLIRDEFGLNLGDSNILFAEIPLNANGKFDRQESLKRFLKQRSWEFPVNIAHLKEFLPHRGGAIWIDALLDSQKDSGVGRVILHETDRAFSEGRLRESSCIEWIAQTYGYTVAMSTILGILDSSPVSKVFIAEVRNCEFDFLNLQLKAGDELRIEVRCTHDFGVLKVVNGKVFHQEKLLAQMGLKLYCA